MNSLPNLLSNNQAWAQKIVEGDQEYFQRLSEIQAPEYLWIGCADSRVPANQIVGLNPGELFVHRNVSNLVVHTDLNCLSVLQFAIEVLKVKHVIVCGHYGCGGVSAALFHKELGLIENWLRNIQDVASIHQDRLDAIESPRMRADHLCELNVIEQVMNVCRTTIVRDAWRKGQFLTVNGWIYGLGDGLIKDLGVGIQGTEEMENAYESAISKLVARNSAI